MLWSEKNRDAKGSLPLPLQNVMINLYKLDKSECVKHLATAEGVSTTYNKSTKDAIKKSIRN